MVIDFSVDSESDRGVIVDKGLGPSVYEGQLATCWSSEVVAKISYQHRRYSNARARELLRRNQ